MQNAQQRYLRSHRNPLLLRKSLQETAGLLHTRFNWLCFCQSVFKDSTYRVQNETGDFCVRSLNTNFHALLHSRWFKLSTQLNVSSMWLKGTFEAWISKNRHILEGSYVWYLGFSECTLISPMSFRFSYICCLRINTSWQRQTLCFLIFSRSQCEY